MDAAMIDEIEKMREIGDRMADALSIMQHAVNLPRDAREALAEWDPIAFPMKRKLAELRKEVI